MNYCSKCKRDLPDGEKCPVCDGDSMAELKPCRYCGNNILGTLLIDEELMSFGEAMGYFQAHCYMCGAKGPVCEDEQQAIDAWNKRS